MLNVDIGAYKRDIETSWFVFAFASFVREIQILDYRLYKIGKFSVDNWIALLMTIVCVIVIRALFNNVIFPYYFEEFS